MIGIEGDDSSICRSLSWRYVHSTTLWFLKCHSDDNDDDDEKLYLKHGKNISMTIENKGEIYLK